VTKMKILNVAIGVAAAAALSIAGTWAARSYAADHLDPPARTNPSAGGERRTADIADIYAWHQGDGAARKFVTALTFNGPEMPTPTQSQACDRDILYTINVSNDADTDAEVTIEARFGADDQGNCFVQFSGIPGVTGSVIARTEHVTTVAADTMVFAGLREDPFFFDLDGFRAIPAPEPGPNGLGGFTRDDFFEGQNDSTIVIEAPYAAVAGTADAPIKVWATTARFGGV